MNNIQYFIVRVIHKLKHNDDEVYSNFFRKKGMKIGKKCHIYSNIITNEAFLVEIGDNVTISNEVSFITHDNSICKPMPEFSDLFGRIKIGDNCFIGSHAMILQGVSIANNTIIAAGSIVTKSFYDEKKIIGGNPAKVIGTWDKYIEKNKKNGMNINGLSIKELKKEVENSEKLFWKK